MGIGAAVSIILAVTGFAGKAIIVFQIIGASFGPICGAMLVDYMLAGKKWAGPRAGFNPAGWISWALGFIVGLLPIIKVYDVPAAPVAAFIVGAVVYFAKIIEWTFPGFSVDRNFAQLCALQSERDQEGAIRTIEHRFILMAQKEQA